MKSKLLLAVCSILWITGCSSNNSNSLTPQVDGTDGAMYYALEHPISLDPAITSAMNSNTLSNEHSFDSDLLGLASSITKIQTYKVVGDTQGSVGVFNLGGKTENFKTTFDTVMYASYPININLVNPADNTVHNVPVIPLIGSGVRIVANYSSNKGNLGASVFSTNIENVNGSVQIQLLGVNRLGANGGGFSQFNLTPESIAIMKEQVATIMSQMWLKNTIIQPKIVGYTVLSPSNQIDTSPSKIIPLILAKVSSLSDYFFETQVMELYQLGRITASQIPIARRSYSEAKLNAETADEKYIISEMIRLLIEDRDWKKSNKEMYELVQETLNALPSNMKVNCIGSQDDWNKINAIVGDIVNRRRPTASLSCI